MNYEPAAKNTLVIALSFVSAKLIAESTHQPRLCSESEADCTFVCLLNWTETRWLLFTIDMPLRCLTCVVGDKMVFQSEWKSSAFKSGELSLNPSLRLGIQILSLSLDATQKNTEKKTVNWLTVCYPIDREKSYMV